MFSSTASATRSFAPGAEKAAASSFLSCISDLAAAAPGGMYSRIVESGLSIVAENSGDTAILVVSAPVIVSVTGSAADSSSLLSWVIVIAAL